MSGGEPDVLDAMLEAATMEMIDGTNPGSGHFNPVLLRASEFNLKRELSSLLVRRRARAVSNHEAPSQASSFETRRRRRSSG